jgi:predicted ATP-grasp superfamily ATP-dependent carboligase
MTDSESPPSKHRSAGRAPRSGLDAKMIAAVMALVTALSGAVELRVQVGLLASKVDRIESEMQRISRTASNP